MRRVGWWIMTGLAMFIALYGATVLLLPDFGPPFVKERRLDFLLPLLAHLGGGVVAMAAGPWQFSARIRQRHRAFHRWTGRIYVAACSIGGLGGLALATRSVGGMVTHLGFGLLAIAWLACTSMAYLSIRRRAIAEHRQWMTRSYALTYAAVMLRIYIPLSQVAGIEYTDAYRVISWLCWVPNLLVAEWLIRSRSTSEVLAMA